MREEGSIGVGRRPVRPKEIELAPPPGGRAAARTRVDALVTPADWVPPAVVAEGQVVLGRLPARVVHLNMTPHRLPDGADQRRHAACVRPAHAPPALLSAAALGHVAVQPRR